MPKLNEEQKKEKFNTLEKVASVRGGRPLFTEWPGAKTKVQWECSCGQIWLANPNNILNGSWCPKCSSGLSERICRELFNRLFNCQFEKIRPSWLSFQGKHLELDGYCASLGLAFEHNGIQHYKEGLFCDDLGKRELYDRTKRELCAKNGVALIVIPALFSKLPLEDLKQYIINSCKILGFEPPHLDAQVEYVGGFLDFITKLEELSEIARRRGGKCLAERYYGWNKKLLFRCGCGYEWKATPFSIRRGTWCPRCANKIQPTIQDIQGLAASRGGRLISKAYENNWNKLEWECSYGHRWLTSYNAVKDAGHWCPLCGVKRRSENRRLDISVYRNAAISKGGICLSETIKSCHDNLEFECKYGHRWFGRADQIKNTKQWCPECAMIRRISCLKRKAVWPLGYF
jgi:hypothetical protein